MASGAVFLMYHELGRDGRPLCHPEEGYARYVLHENGFRQHLNCLQRLGLRGVSISQALAQPDASQIAITFDDGCETDLLIAAPLLKERGWNATFFVTVGFLNQPGYMTPKQVRELSEVGLEIGSHSMTHPYLNELDNAKLTYELVESKKRLEDVTGTPIQHFSNPGGRSSAQSRAVAKQAGYLSVSSSRPGVNRGRTNSFDLARVAILRDTPMDRFEQIAQGRGLRSLAWKQQARELVRKSLGNRAYDAVRGRLLKDSTP